MMLQGGRGPFLHQDLRKELAEEIWGGSCDGLASGPRDRKVSVRVVREGVRRWG